MCNIELYVLLVVGDGVNGVYPHLYNIHSSLLPNKQHSSPEHKQVNMCTTYHKCV